MKASELIAELQRGVREGRDWEVVTTDGTPVEVVWSMPSLREREDGAQPYVTLAWPKNPADGDCRPFGEGANWTTLATHDGNGMPTGIELNDRVEVELPNGDHMVCRAQFVRWHWTVDYAPGDNFGRHMPDNVMAWRKL